MSGLSGARELDRALSNLLRAAAPEVAERALMAGAEVFAEEARQHVHRRSGGLADSIDASTTANDDASQPSAPKAFAGPTLPEGAHGHLEEFGTEDAPAHAFMRPAFDARAADAERAIADKVRTEIAQRAKG